MDQSCDKIEVDDIYITYLHILFSALPAGAVLFPAVQVRYATQPFPNPGQLRFLCMA